MHEFADLKTTMDQIVAYEQVFRQRLAKTMTPEKFTELEADGDDGEAEAPECDFATERSKLESDREDAAEAQHERAREDFDEEMERLREMKADRLRDEAIELMVREPDEDSLKENR